MHFFPPTAARPPAWNLQSSKQKYGTDEMSFVRKCESKDCFKLTENKYKILQYCILVILNSVLDMPNKEILIFLALQPNE